MYGGVLGWDGSVTPVLRARIMETARGLENDGEEKKRIGVW